MKKRVLFYCAAAFATFSMQSCVTNYVVSTPTTYVNEYKSNAKLASIDNKKLAVAKEQLLSSFQNEHKKARKWKKANFKKATWFSFRKVEAEFLMLESWRV